MKTASTNRARQQDVAPTLFIGPQRRLGAPLLEVMVEITDQDVTVFHVVHARAKHLERMGLSP